MTGIELLGKLSNLTAESPEKEVTISIETEETFIVTYHIKNIIEFEDEIALEIKNNYD